MRNVKDNLWVPDEGYKYITNGSIYTDSIYLGKADSIENWHDTNDEPVDATAEDYEAALERLGVET